MKSPNGGLWLFVITFIVGQFFEIRAHISHKSQNMQAKEKKNSTSKNVTVSDLYNLLEDIIALKVAMLLDEEDNAEKVTTVLSRSRRQIQPLALQAPPMVDPNWFNNVYLPWLIQWLEYQSYEQQRREFIINYLRNYVPPNYGNDASHGGSYYKYSKQAYNQYLHELAESKPIPDDINRAYCLRDWDGVEADGDPCWSTDYDVSASGYCSTLSGDPTFVCTTPAS